MGKHILKQAGNIINYLFYSHSNYIVCAGIQILPSKLVSKAKEGGRVWGEAE